MAKYIYIIICTILDIIVDLVHMLVLGIIDLQPILKKKEAFILISMAGSWVFDSVCDRCSDA